MQHSADLVLWRLLPPFRKRVVVNQITVGGFMKMLGVLSGKLEAIRRIAKRDISEIDVLAAIGERELSLFADLVCADQARGFFSGWLGGYLMGPLTGKNIRALFDASREAEGEGGWTRIMSSLKPKDDAGEGGIMEDVVTISKLMHLNPFEIRDTWPMQDYIVLCESMNLMAKSEERGHERVASAGQLAMIPGVGVTH